MATLLSSPLILVCPRPSRPRVKRCSPVDSTPIRRPDLEIYAQSLVATPTWDSPDITTNSNNPWTLLREPTVRLRNVGQASASGAIVEFLIAEFGIGLPWSTAASQVANVAVAQEVELRFPLAQSTLDIPRQSIGTRVVIRHSADRNLANNAGEQVIAGLSYAPGDRLTDNLRIGNPNLNAATLQLAIVDTSAGIQATLNQAQVVVGPGGETQVGVVMDIPTAIPPPPPLGHHVTVMASEGGVLHGGVTYILRP